MSDGDDIMDAPANGDPDLVDRYVRSRNAGMRTSGRLFGLISVPVVVFVVVKIATGSFGNTVTNVLAGIVALSVLLVMVMGQRRADKRGAADADQARQAAEQERSLRKLAEIEEARARGDFDRWNKAK